MLKPKRGACGVIVPLKAKIAALPDPEIAAKINRPNAAKNLASLQHKDSDNFVGVFMYTEARQYKKQRRTNTIM